jgi:iron complex outermembrane recepter protein
VYKYDAANRSLRSMLLVGAAAVAGFAAPALAQQQQGGVETVVVTGSLLSRSDVETPSPVTILTSQTIQARGLTSTADVVRSLTSDNSGTVPTAFGIGFAAGSSGVALRGLTVNSTLVLINGRRTANYPLADDGQRGFVDLNTIPLDAVDRVEVLKDGASSIYGADAIAGVVNIIMKDDFQGVSGEAEYGTSEHGGGTMNRLAATLGYGDIASDRFNAYINVEYERDNAIHVGQRDFPYNTVDLSSIGGSNFLDRNQNGAVFPGGGPGVATSQYGTVAPVDFATGATILNSQVLAPGGCGPKATLATDANGSYCQQNTALFGDDQPAETRYGVYAHMKERFSSSATAYLDASYFENKVEVDGAPSQIQVSTPHNTEAIHLPAYLANGTLNPNNPYANAAHGCAPTGTEGVTPCDDAAIAYLFGDIPGGADLDNHVLRATAGLKGDWRGWNYDTAFVAAHAWLYVDNKGFINYPQLLNDIADGSYSFVNPASNTPAVRSALAPDLTKTSITDEDSWDMRASHDIFALPGGEAQIGFSLEARHENTFDTDLNPSLNAQGLGLAHTIGNRNIYSASAELGLPITSTLEADLSGRYDHYSDFGDTFNPKVGLKWTPIPQIGLRGTYSTGFRAPSFSENGSSASEGFTTFNPSTSTRVPASWILAHGADGYTGPYALGQLATANADIKPEKSRNFTFGAILQPFTDVDLNGTVDYYNIQKTSVIAGQSTVPAIIAAFAGTPIPAGFTVVFDAPDPQHPTAPLRPVVVGAPYINAASLKTNGFDVNIHFGTDLWEGVHWSNDFDYSQIMKFSFTPNAGAAPQSYVGTQAPYILSSGAGTPRDKASLESTLSWADLSVTGTLYYTSGLKESTVDLTGDTNCDLYINPPKKFCQVNAFWDFDLTARYHLNDSVDLFGGVKNVFDTKPPLDVVDYAGVNYNPTYAQAGIVGRFFNVGVSFKD